MPRNHVIYSSVDPYHVTARSNNRDWFDVPMNYCYGIYINVLDSCISRFNIRPHVFVLMSNHFHLILSTPDANIGIFLRYFMTESSKGIGAKSMRINHIYGGRNHKSLITQSTYYAHCFKYVVRNPVRAGLCHQVEDYRWSSFSKVPSRMKRLMFAIGKQYGERLPSNEEQLLNWLNEPTPKEIEEQCRKAIKRSSFEFKPDRKNQKRVDPLRGLSKT